MRGAPTSGRRPAIRRALPWLALGLALCVAVPAAGQEESPPEEEAEPTAVDEEEPEAEGEEEGAVPEAPEPVGLERIRFQVPFSDASGGGTAVGSAGSLEYERPDLVVAGDGVEITYREYRIQADTMTVDLATKKVRGEGQIILDQGPRRLTGATLDFDLESETGTLTEAQAFVSPDIFFSGAEIAKIGEDVYTVTNGVVTSCLDEVPDWSFRLGTARVNMDGYTRVRNTSMRVKKLPIVYTPYLLWPSDRGRKSGILFPRIGSSRLRGYVLNLGYYQTLGRSYDATLFADVYESDYFGVGGEFRYAPTVNTGGVVQGYTIDDPTTEATRWKANLYHTSNALPLGLRGVLRVQEYSDFDFFVDFERDFNQISIRRLNSYGFVTGNWGSHSFNLLAEKNEVFIRRGETVEQSQLPELEYRLRSTRLGPLPAYLEVDSSAHSFSVSRTGVFDDGWQRADLFPRITVPLSYWPWLSVSVTGGGRTTYYSDSLTPQGNALSGSSLTRFFPTANAEIVGPSFSRIFNKNIGRFGKFKHIIEPRWTYFFAGDFDDRELIPLFDEIDTFRKSNIFAVSLINRLLAKSADPESLEGAREIFSFELSQAFSLNEDQPFAVSRDRTMETTRGPILGRLRFSPGGRTNLEGRFSINPLFDRLDSASLSGGWSSGLTSLGLSWYTRFNPENGDTTTHQARVYSQFDVIRNRVRVGSEVNYDFVQRLLQYHRHTLTYFSQCWGFSIGFRELRSFAIREREIRFALSLKNVGTFLDLNSGSRDTY